MAEHLVRNVMLREYRRSIGAMALASLPIFLVGTITRAESQASRGARYESIGSIERLDPALDEIVSAGAKLEVLCDGFEWSEGPVWIGEGGFVLFSDIPNNAIMRWDEKSGCTLFLKPAGYTGSKQRGGETGSNGLALDHEGRLLLCQHGDRRIARLEAPWNAPTADFKTLADRYNGRRFNSPNDLVVHSNGDIYFTDPPYGLAKNMEDSAKELDFQGVYCLSPEGKVTLVTRELERPNGIALSPDEKTLYVANSHEPRPVIMAYPLKHDGSVGAGRVLFDARNLPATRLGSCDGMAIDKNGNLFATGPGGVLIITPDGKHIGSLLTTKATANCKFGDDGQTLFITADDSLLRIRTKTKGLGFD